jgi:phytoene dehydrogenase-like protein
MEVLMTRFRSVSPLMVSGFKRASYWAMGGPRFLLSFWRRQVEVNSEPTGFAKGFRIAAANRPVRRHRHRRRPKRADGGRLSRQGGLRTLVLERRPIVGGAAVTEEFHPGYRNSIASYVLSLLRPEVIRDLELKRQGLSLIPFRGSLDLLSDGRALLFTGEEMHDRAEVARFSNRDYEAMGALRERLQRWAPSCAISCCGSLRTRRWDRRDPVAAAPRRRRSPANAGGPALPHPDVHAERQRPDGALVRERGDAAGLCRALRLQQLREPGRAGSAIPFFINVLGEFEGKQGRWGLAKGGMGAVTQAMASAAREHGVEIRTASPVARVLLRDGRAEGVRWNPERNCAPARCSPTPTRNARFSRSSAASTSIPPSPTASRICAWATPRCD